MKRNFRLYALALVALLTGGVFFSACTTGDDGVIREDVFTLEPVKAPKIIAYSGTNYFGGKTRSSYMNANMYDQDWDCVPNVYPDLTDEDLAEIIRLLSKGEPTENTEIFPFENYWVQQVFKGTDTYVPTDINGNPVNDKTITGSNQMDKLVAYNANVTNQEYGGYLDENNQWHQVVTENHYEHVNNFNYGDNTNTPGQCGCGIVHEGTTLMYDMSTEGITPNNQFGFHESFGTSHNYNNYIIIQYKGYWYVGFDYEMHKDEAQNPNEAKNVERDWNFTDWIVRITPAYHKGMTPTTPEQPEQPEPDPTCPKCDHPEHEDGNCPECDEHEGCNPPAVEPDPETPDQPGDETPETPDTPAVWEDEVEVNLSLDKKDGYHSSHLSIHVRSETDVDIFIPIPEKYLYKNDDLLIARSKQEGHVIYGGPKFAEYEIDGMFEDSGEYHTFKVTLYCEYTNEAGEPGIHVWTDGINEKCCGYSVIDLCRAKYGDGLTFEIWNYFSLPELVASIDFELLQECMNKATIKFLDKTPDAYINAFNEDENGKKFEYDCTVEIRESNQRDEYDGPKEGPHYNGSEYNQIYKKK